jgi:hypothetical protein
MQKVIRVAFVVLSVCLLGACSIVRSPELWILSHSVPEPPEAHNPSHGIHPIPAEDTPVAYASFDSDLMPDELWGWYREALTKQGWVPDYDYSNPDMLVVHQTTFGRDDYALILDIYRVPSGTGPVNSSQVHIRICSNHFWEQWLVKPRFLLYRLGFGTPAFAWLL